MSSKMITILTLSLGFAFAQAKDVPNEIPLLQLAGLDGKTVNSAEWKGKVVVLDFWATWCVACREAFPELTSLKAKYGDRVVIVGVSSDKSSPDKVTKFVNKQKLNYLVLLDPNDSQSSVFGYESIPFLVIYGTDGKLIASLKGLEEANKKILEDALAKNVK